MITPKTLERFPPIGLAEMDAVGLQFRMDTKYVFSASLLDGLFGELASGYRVLELNGMRGVEYTTRYFDTVGLKHYFDHHNGRSFRSKVRVRHYGGSNLYMLEVKRRTGRGGTDKRRTPLIDLPAVLDADQHAFAALYSNCSEPLFHVLDNRFHRLTFVHRERLERLTIDTNIVFTRQGREVALPGMVVAELKEGRTGHGSPFAAAMRRRTVPPTRFSKYCIGSALTNPGLQHNAFKPVLLRVQKTTLHT